MRRALLRFLPVFWLALTVQILAPVGACLARAIVANDPLAGAMLCAPGGAHDPSDAQHHQAMRDGSCAACAAAQPFNAPSPPAMPLAILHPDYRVVWHSAVPDLRAAKLASHAFARGPPVLS